MVQQREDVVWVIYCYGNLQAGIWEKIILINLNTGKCPELHGYSTEYRYRSEHNRATLVCALSL
jgi:hypothetical protein